MTRTIHLSLIIASLLLSGLACSDDDSTTDGAAVLPDGTPTVDAGNLWPCETPGQSCNAHDPCAIDPICGEDHLCHPTMVQSCDDGLACTTDTCQGMGLCDHVPKEGWCAVSVFVPAPSPDGGAPDAGASGGTSEVQCFEDGQSDPNDPCMVCKPEESATDWQPANGGACDDGDPCTMDDYCQAGVCKGVDFHAKCADELSCTEDLCDGKGGCDGNPLKSDWCLIGGKCYKDQQTHPDGSCNICDVGTSQSAWTPISDTCMIGGVCYNTQAPHPTGQCAKCDPSTATDAWTATGNGCFIDDQCYVKDALDPLKCSKCDPTTSPTSWTPLSGKCLIDGVCYNDGELSPNKCSECDSSTSPTSWTPLPNMCLIDGTCYTDGKVHPEGCAKCDSSADPTAWTVTSATQCVVAGSCVDKATSFYACGACGVSCGAGETCTGGKCTCGALAGTVGGGPICPADQSCDQTQGQCVNLPPGTLGAPFTLDFEMDDGGLAGTKDWEWGKIATWSPTSNCDSTSSTDPPMQGHSGMGVWATKVNDCYSPLGNAGTACSNSGTTDDSVLSFDVKIPSNWTTATMTFWEWYDLFLTFDWSEIRVDGTVVTQTCTGSKASPVSWKQRTVDLSAYAGKIVTVSFHMLATSVVQYSGWYIDDLSISGS